MLKPTRKPNHGWTHHNDGTTSFFNQITGQWERGDSKAYLRAFNEHVKSKVNRVELTRDAAA